MHRLLTAILATLATATALAPALAAAQDPPDTRCAEVGEAVELLDRLGRVEADRRDVVDVRPRPRFTTTDGAPLPQQVWLRNRERSVAVRVAPDGAVEGDLLGDARSLGKRAEMCVRDPRIADGTADNAFGFQAGLFPEFVSTSGTHTLAELREGGRDARSFYRKMVPALMRPLVPSLRHVAVSHPLDDTDALPRVTAWRGAEALGSPPMEPVEPTQLLALDTLDALGADRITVEGDYRLFPVPDAKTLRRFMQEDEE